MPDAEISIASVIQKEAGEGSGAEIVIMTHDAREASMRGAIATMTAVDGIHGVAQMLRVHT